VEAMAISDEGPAADRNSGKRTGRAFVWHGVEKTSTAETEIQMGEGKDRNLWDGKKRQHKTSTKR